MEIDVKLLKKDIIFDSRQLQAKFKHAEHFGIEGTWNTPNGNLFKEKILEHINNPDTIAIAGKYTRGGVRDVVHYYNPKTKINVMKEKNGQFLSGWRLGQRQRPLFEKTGILGGG